MYTVHTFRMECMGDIMERGNSWKIKYGNNCKDKAYSFYLVTLNKFTPNDNND